MAPSQIHAELGITEKQGEGRYACDQHQGVEHRIGLFRLDRGGRLGAGGVKKRCESWGGGINAA
jgi:hypothetical protein